MRTVVIIQARLGSSRLPAKVMLDLGGRTALERCLRRAQKIEGASEVVLATTHHPIDDLIATLADRLGYRVFRGSETDVLDRYMQTARATNADVIIRCTSDCPLLDPVESSSVLKTFLAQQNGQGADYASNVLERRLPRGLDTEVVSRSALERAHVEAHDVSEREHVTQHLLRNRELFRCVYSAPVSLSDAAADLSHHRWTLDTLADYHFLAKLHTLLGEAAETASLPEVLQVLEQHPQLSAINATEVQKAT